MLGSNGDSCRRIRKWFGRKWKFLFEVSSFTTKLKMEFDKKMEGLRRKRVESERKWKELSRKWKEVGRKWNEDGRKWKELWRK